MTRDAIIYIVDDDDHVRDSLRLFLECEGFKVTAFASCVEFLRCANLAGRICVVLDVNMPSMSGLELLDKLCRDNIFLPVVLMTGRPDAAIAKAAARAGAILLEKPFKGTELLNCVKRMLGVH